MIHEQPHPLAGKTVVIKSGSFKGREFWVEDWWDKLTGQSWGESQGNPAALKYAMRTGMVDREIGDDDEVVYGKFGVLGELIHNSELGEVVHDGRR